MNYLLQFVLLIQLHRAESAWHHTTTAKIVWSDLGPCNNGQWLSFYWSRQNTIAINTECDWHKRPLDLAVQHEVGHALGLDHSPDSRSVMFHLVSKGQRIMPEDRGRL